MRLTSTDGSFVDLTIAQYQFPKIPARSTGDRWDANWLVIRGWVADGQLMWSFKTPCLTSFEAREVSAWLRRVASGGDVDLWEFTEPNLSLSLRARTEADAVIRFSFSHESWPPWLPEEDRYGDGHPVEIATSMAEISAAADEWDAELLEFPLR